VFLVLAIGVVWFALFQPIQVLPRIRIGPGFAMIDSNGDLLTSDSTRGQVTLYNFAYGDCGEECEDIEQTMAEIAKRVQTEVDLGDVDLNLVTVSFDPDRDAGRLGELAAEWGADGETWRWATPTPADATKTILGPGFGVFYEPNEDGTFDFDPRYVIVDGWGVVRGEYQYTTLTGDADKLVRHIGLLGEEIRNSNGAASIAYEAAHVFLCYP
jgi:protein SCO1/2